MGSVLNSGKRNTVHVFSNPQYSQNLHKKGLLMSNFYRVFIVLAALVVAGCASPPAPENSVAATGTAASVAAGAESGDDPDELICRREQVTGTNFRRRVCMTRAQREQEQSDSQEEMLERRSAVR